MFLGPLIPEFISLVAVLLTLVSYQRLTSKSSGRAASGDDVRVQWRNQWLAAYLTASISDWLKGPYLYSIYESYGYEGAQLVRKLLARGSSAFISALPPPMAQKSPLIVPELPSANRAQTQLFVAGYLSSGIFGLLVGAAADRWGRRRSCCAFGLLYVTASLLIQVNHFGVLLLGRVLSGVATSLLGTCFETWAVSEHRRSGHAAATVGQTLSLATAGSGLVAVCAGLGGELVASTLGKPHVFLAAIPFAAASWGLSATLPSENWGREEGEAVAAKPQPLLPAKAAAKAAAKATAAGATAAAALAEEAAEAEAAGAAGAVGVAGAASAKKKPALLVLLGQAVAEVAASPALQLLMAQQALFEGSMHLFVFVWTPHLQGKLRKGASNGHKAAGAVGAGAELPLGLVFACFMVTMMVGSRLLALALSDGRGGKVRNAPQRCRRVATAAFALGGLALGGVTLEGLGRTTKVLLFCAFELCVGLYYPSFGTLKAMQIPDHL